MTNASWWLPASRKAGCRDLYYNAARCSVRSRQRSSRCSIDVASIVISGPSRPTRSGENGASAAIGVITTASFGVALISRVRHFTTNFEAALFGNILGVTTTDPWVIAGVSLLTVIALFFSYKQMLFTTFDPEVSPTYGVPTQKMETLFALILASALIASMQVMGVTLIAAALVIPAVIGRLLTDSFSKLLLLTTVIGALCGLTSLYTSFSIDVASGATIVLTAAAVFAVVITIMLVQQRRHGLKAGLGKQAVLVQSNDPHLF